MRSLKFEEVELLIEAQGTHSLRLSVLFGGNESVDGGAVIRKACELFAIPMAQVERKDLFDQSYELTMMIGFKRPCDISIPKERSDGE